ncbi:TPA: hypothetical protein N0F65_002990 [Lagenidium giganteum]|uniref:PH domain-containing protein n=1 Tax=Lagenidium giganteum TaxID=4803 RepID=A0AAV2YNW6_9STRA|nr:TPA: hypothetical protein N0F65_002990 [Lagenidium giganteum]
MKRESLPAVFDDGYAEGYLTKFGGRVRKWKKRYFVFDNGYLHYRRGVNDSFGAKRSANYRVFDVAYCPTVEFGLCIKTLCGTVLQVKAKSEDQVTQWHDTFQSYLLSEQTEKELRQLMLKRCDHMEPIQESEEEAERLSMVWPLVFFRDSEQALG